MEGRAGQDAGQGRTMQQVVAKYEGLIKEFTDVLERLDLEKQRLLEERQGLQADVEGLQAENSRLRTQLAQTGNEAVPSAASQDAAVAELNARLQDERRNRLHTEEQYSSIITQQEESTRRLEEKLKQANEAIAALEEKAGGGAGGGGGGGGGGGEVSRFASANPSQVKYRIRSPRSGSAQPSFEAAAAAPPGQARPSPSPQPQHSTLHFGRVREESAEPVPLRRSAPADPLPGGGYGGSARRGGGASPGREVSRSPSVGRGVAHVPGGGGGVRRAAQGPGTPGAAQHGQGQQAGGGGSAALREAVDHRISSFLSDMSKELHMMDAAAANRAAVLNTALSRQSGVQEPSRPGKTGPGMHTQPPGGQVATETTTRNYNYLSLQSNAWRG